MDAIVYKCVCLKCGERVAYFRRGGVGRRFWNCAQCGAAWEHRGRFVWGKEEEGWREVPEGVLLVMSWREEVW